MKSLTWLYLFFIIIISIIIPTFLVNIVVDPLGITNKNILNLNKIVQKPRIQHIKQLEKLQKVDTLILGSSRVRHFNPEYVNSYMKGFTYNASVTTGLIEDYLGYLLFLKKINKLPKNLILGIDFYAFNDQVPLDENFLTTKELNFISHVERDYLQFLSLEMLRLSIKNLKVVKEVKEEVVSNGFNKFSDYESDVLIRNNNYNFTQRIKDVSFSYMKFNYSYKTYNKISKQRLAYFEKLINFVREHNIKIYVFVTPVHAYHHQKIVNNDVLSKTLNEFKQHISLVTPYYDFMFSNNINSKEENFYDAVHPREHVCEYIVEQLLDNNSSINYGHFIKKNSF